jgi:hypothetical protein
VANPNNCGRTNLDCGCGDGLVDYTWEALLPLSYRDQCAVGLGVNILTLSVRGTYSSRRNVFSVRFLDDSKDEQNSFLESA